jgi:hypothetical protein
MIQAARRRFTPGRSSTAVAHPVVSIHSFLLTRPLLFQGYYHYNYDTGTLLFVAINGWQSPTFLVHKI